MTADIQSRHSDTLKRLADSIQRLAHDASTGDQEYFVMQCEEVADLAISLAEYAGDLARCGLAGEEE